MKVRGTLVLLLALAGAAAAKDRPFDLQISYGGWTLSPFRPLVETECERLIRNGFDGTVAGTITAALLAPIQSNVALSSSGHLLSTALWYRIGESRFAVGFEGEYFDLRVPFTISARTSLEILGIPLAAVDGSGRGEARLRGLAASFLGRWALLSTRRMELSLRGGLMLMPFRGDISLDASGGVTTPLGDFRISESLSQTIAQIRGLGFDTPSLILSPVLGVDVRYRFTPDVGVFLAATAAQGSSLSGGLVFSF